MSRSNRSINQNTWHLRQNCFVSNLKRPDCWTPDMMGPASSWLLKEKLAKQYLCIIQRGKKLFTFPFLSFKMTRMPKQQVHQKNANYSRTDVPNIEDQRASANTYGEGIIYMKEILSTEVHEQKLWETKGLHCNAMQCIVGKYVAIKRTELQQLRLPYCGQRDSISLRQTKLAAFVVGNHQRYWAVSSNEVLRPLILRYMEWTYKIAKFTSDFKVIA